MVKNLPANIGDAGDKGWIPGLGSSPGGGHGNPLQYSWLENPTDREAWWAMVHRVAKRQAGLKQISTYAPIATSHMPLSVGFSRQEHWEWVAISSLRESSQPRHRTRVSRTVRQILYH